MQRPFACHFALEVAFWAIATSSCALLGCGGKTIIERASDSAAPPDAGSISCGDTQSDNRNCGACGMPCAGTCNSGRCTVTLAPMQANVDCIAVDAKSVYWVNAGLALDEGSGELRQAALGGGAFTTLATAPGIDIGWPCRMRVGHSSVYWTTGNLGGPVFRIPVTGGSPLLIAPLELGATALVLNDTDVYWAGPYAGVRKAPLAGSPLTALSMQGGSDIAIDAAHVYWTFNDEPNTDSKIMSLPLNGGTPTDLVTGLNDPMAIAADASGVYWVDYGTGTVGRAAPDGTVTTLASAQFNPRVIALDDSNVYWGTALGDVVKVSKAGGTPTELAFSANVLDLAVDASSVYWTDGSQVLKVTPK